MLPSLRFYTTKTQSGHRRARLNHFLSAGWNRYDALSGTLGEANATTGIYRRTGQHGSMAAATRTPMVCCDSIFRAEQISHASRKTT
jgi:hypothetical protein